MGAKLSHARLTYAGRGMNLACLDSHEWQDGQAVWRRVEVYEDGNVVRTQCYRRRGAYWLIHGDQSSAMMALWLLHRWAERVEA